MTCGLDDDELTILRYLYKHRCLSLEHTKRLDAIERDLGTRIDDLERKLDSLVGKRFLGCKKKKAKNYYADASQTARALTAHNMAVWRGGRGRI